LFFADALPEDERVKPPPATMRLTPELAARLHRVFEDRGPPPGRVPTTDADHEATIRALFGARAHPTKSGFSPTGR
jgi:hypothetical protein